MKNFDKVNLTLKIKKKAKEIGFDLIGICSAEPFKEAFSILQKRKLSEFVSENKEILTNPKRHLASVKSIIALGLSYAGKIQEENDEDQYIAFYARGKDYHYVIQEKMSKLIRFLKFYKNDIEYLAYSDTGALLDREVAKRAGLGWIGKSNNLINPVYGSYIFLGEILTNLDLKFDKPLKSQCGNCTLCISNCPVQALKEYYLEADKCLSYITQKKGILTEKERLSMKNNLWGCDKCLQVCPHNKGIPFDIHPEFSPVIKGDMKKVLNFTKNNFTEEWNKSALSWRGLRILKRNTIINIANKGDNEYTPLLKKELNNPSPILRAYAAWALGRIANNGIRNDLIKHYKREKNKLARDEIKRLFKNNSWGEI